MGVGVARFCGVVDATPHRALWHIILIPPRGLWYHVGQVAFLHKLKLVANRVVDAIDGTGTRPVAQPRIHWGHILVPE